MPRDGGYSGGWWRGFLMAIFLRDIVKQGVILLTQNSLAGAAPLDPRPSAIARAKDLEVVA